MELRHLRYFVEVARSGSFTRAALVLGIQQPPLSQQVRDLERELGYALFHRLPRGVELTAGGAVFLEEAKGVLATVDRGVARAAQAAHGSAGSLVLGFTSSAVMHELAPRLIHGYRAANPGVALEFREAGAALVTEAVAARQLDIGFIRRPVSELSGIAFHALAEEPILAAVPASHPLAVRLRDRREGALHLRELAQENFIFVRRPGAPGIYGDFIEACRKAGLSPRVVAEVDQMLTNVMLVAAGVGVSIVPASMRDVHRGSVVYAPILGVPKLRAPLTLVSRDADANPVVQRFVRFALALGPEARAAVRSRPASGATRAGASPPRKRRSRAPARKW